MKKLFTATTTLLMLWKTRGKKSSDTALRCQVLEQQQVHSGPYNHYFPCIAQVNVFTERMPEITVYTTKCYLHLLTIVNPTGTSS